MDQRERFEANYVIDLNKATGKDYTAEQMKDLRDGDGYGEDRHYLNGRWDGWQAAEAAALERAAHVCASYSVDKWNLYKGRAPYNGSESGRANPYVEGQSDGAEECAADIRKLAAPVERGGE
jgi:hypothetical protein